MNYTEEQLFSQRIKELRQKLGISQQQMADAVGLRKTAISNYESGYSTPNFKTIKKFTHCFNMPLSYFFPDKEDVPELNYKLTQLMYGSAIHYFEPDNITALISDDLSKMNSVMSLPARFLGSGSKHVSTSAPDNSMNLAGIKRGSCVVIDSENKNPVSDQIFAAVCDGELIIRRYIDDDGKRYMKAESNRIPSGMSLKEIPEENFVILGVVDAVVSKI